MRNIMLKRSYCLTTVQQTFCTVSGAEQINAASTTEITGNASPQTFDLDVCSDQLTCLGIVVDVVLNTGHARCLEMIVAYTEIIRYNILRDRQV